jgi:hypothetical protein
MFPMTPPSPNVVIAPAIDDWVHASSAMSKDNLESTLGSPAHVLTLGLNKNL